MRRLYYMNVVTGKEFSIVVKDTEEILPKLKANPQYNADPDNWEFFDEEPA